MAYLYLSETRFNWCFGGQWRSRTRNSEIWRLSLQPIVRAVLKAPFAFLFTETQPG